MRKDSVLADLESITPDDLKDKPLILSQQESQGGSLTQWIGQEVSDLNIIATYNLLYNASLLVDEGLGYAIGYDKIINTSGNSRLCFRPLKPRLGNKMSIIWKNTRSSPNLPRNFLKCCVNHYPSRNPRTNHRASDTEKCRHESACIFLLPLL